MSEACNYCAVEPCRCRPSRLERVAEALFVQAIAERSLSVGSTPTIKQMAETAIQRALVFERAWGARES